MLLEGQGRGGTERLRRAKVVAAGSDGALRFELVLEICGGAQQGREEEVPAGRGSGNGSGRAELGSPDELAAGTYADVC
jgi:hypothetical protein